MVSGISATTNGFYKLFLDLPYNIIYESVRLSTKDLFFVRILPGSIAIRFTWEKIPQEYILATSEKTKSHNGDYK